jgi:hypothetical protein
LIPVLEFWYKNPSSWIGWSSSRRGR